MKDILNICCASAFTGVVLIAVGQLDSASPSTAARSTKPVVSRYAPAPMVALGSHARLKVVQYFDTYRTNPLGLPPSCAAAIKVEEIPESWTTAGIAPGKVVQVSERQALVEAPAELVRALPAGQPAVRYFLAGTNLVAVDSGYKVVDSIRLPRVRLSVAEPGAEAGSLQIVEHRGL